LVASKQVELDIAKVELHRLQQEQSHLSVEHRDLQGRLSKVESDYSGKDKLLQKARRSIQSVECKLSSTKTELKQVRQELSQLSSEYTALQGRLKEIKCLADAKETI
jgi:chromosome segregation ATPase